MSVRGCAGTVSLRRFGYGWRLFLGEYGVADWPSKSAIDDPEGYAREVVRVVRKALADAQRGPLVRARPLRASYRKPRYARLRIAGSCQNCGAEAVNGTTRCTPCGQRNARLKRARAGRSECKERTGE